MIYAFTSAALYYLPKARLCLGSLRCHHPEFRLCYALADRLPAGMRIEEACVDEVIPVESLPEIGTPGWIFQHSIVELSTGIKGAVLRRLLARDDCDAVLYFDPDIVLFSRLDDLVERLKGASVVLTPHQTSPDTTRERILDNEIGSLRYGIFNLGFLGVRKCGAGMAFADWWAERLRHFCKDRIEIGLFTDQKWINHAPVFFEGVAILKDTRFNVATWNITTRTMAGVAPDRITIDRKPLGFYHFTGFDSGAHGLMAGRNAGGNEVLHQLIDWYERRIAMADSDHLAKLPSAFGTYFDGTTIEHSHRRIYGMRTNLQQVYPDPFGPRSSGAGEFPSFLAWVQARAAAEYPELCGDEAARLLATEAENGRLKQELRALKDSLSWRLTKPLRALS